MLKITSLAATKVQEFLQQNGRPEAGLRVRVVGGGCSGFQYQLALDDSASEGDEVFEQEGVKLFVDPRSFLYLDGTEIDYVEDIMGSGFRFNNPNSTGSCGCGESFQVGRPTSPFGLRRVSPKRGEGGKRPTLPQAGRSQAKLASLDRLRSRSHRDRRRGLRRP